MESESENKESVLGRDSRRNVEDVVATSLDISLLKKASEEFEDLEVDQLLIIANRIWPDLASISNMGSLTIGPLSSILGYPWPRTRVNEKIEKYLHFDSAQALSLIRGFGNNKIKTILKLIVTLYSIRNQISSGDSPRSYTGAFAGDSNPPIPQEKADAVDVFWDRISATVRSSAIAEKLISDLAKEWGIKWPERTLSKPSLTEVLSSKSLHDFIARTRGMGKNKRDSLASIVWRAWQFVEPDGLAGPFKSGEETAKVEFDSIYPISGISGVIAKVFEVSNLPYQHISIIKRRYGLEGLNRMTLEEIGLQEGVTRERVRQIQQLSEERIASNSICKQLLKITLNYEVASFIENLRSSIGVDLIREENEPHRLLSSEHSFLVHLQYEDVYRYLDFLSANGTLEKTSSGWWIGGELPDNYEEVIREMRSVLEEEGRPLSIQHFLDDAYDLKILKSLLLVAGLELKGGYVFLNKPTAREKRCLFALAVASSYNKFLWSDLEFYEKAASIDIQKSGTFRLLLGDLESIPGVAIDLPGAYMVVNPKALRLAQVFLKAENSLFLIDGSKKSKDLEECLAVSNSGTLSGIVQGILEKHRLLKYEELEDLFCLEHPSSPGSLGPTLLSGSQFARYAPGYWGIAGLELEDQDIDVLCSVSAVKAYIRSKLLGGLDELFLFWGPEMEYRWCRWAEHYGDEDLFHSLLAVCEPERWNTIGPIQSQWNVKKDSLGRLRLSLIKPSLKKAFIGFRELYGLVHLACERGKVGPITISHLYGLRDADARSIGTLALLAAMGVLEPRDKIDSSWGIGSKANEWLDLMTEMHFNEPLNLEFRWVTLLTDFVKNLHPNEVFGWFTASSLQENYRVWLEAKKV